MLLSYAIQKTGRLTFEEKCKMLEFAGKLAANTTFTPRLSGDGVFVSKYIHPAIDPFQNTTHSNLSLDGIDTQSIADS
jgi:hypothetical protein